MSSPRARAPEELSFQMRSDPRSPRDAAYGGRPARSGAGLDRCLSVQTEGTGTGAHGEWAREVTASDDSNRRLGGRGRTSASASAPLPEPDRGGTPNRAPTRERPSPAAGAPEGPADPRATPGRSGVPGRRRTRHAGSRGRGIVSSGRIGSETALERPRQRKSCGPRSLPNSRLEGVLGWISARSGTATSSSRLISRGLRRPDKLVGRNRRRAAPRFDLGDQGDALFALEMRERRRPTSPRGIADEARSGAELPVPRRGGGSGPRTMSMSLTRPTTQQSHRARTESPWPSHKALSFPFDAAAE